MPKLTISIRPDGDVWVITAIDTGDSANQFHGHYESLKFGLARLSEWLRRMVKEQTQ